MGIFTWVVGSNHSPRTSTANLPGAEGPTPIIVMENDIYQGSVGDLAL